MLKLLFLDRSGLDSSALLLDQQAVLARTEAALEAQLKSATGFGRILSLWRLSVGRAALSFVEGVLDSRVVEPIVYHPIGYVSSLTHRAQRDAAAGDGRHGRRVD